MVLGILCEKRLAAEKMAKALGGMSGSYNGENYIIVGAQGHLYQLAEPYDMVSKELSAKYKSWDVNNLPWSFDDFNWKRVENKSMGADSARSRVRSGLAKCDEIAIATDLDPSGEGGLIGVEILQEMGFTNKKISRMYFTDESATSFRKAFTDRKPIPNLAEYDEYLKADYRSKFDFLTIQFTRIATALANRTMLRQGRLKSAMVLLVGMQLEAYNSYEKVPFYQVRFKDENGVVYTSKTEPQYKDKNDTPKHYVAGPIVFDSSENKRTPPPRLLTLAAVGSALGPKGYKAKMVLDVYQKMYEAGIVSYPRTEDKNITHEQFNELLPHVDAIADLVGANKALLTKRVARPTHVKDEGAHGANRPGLNVPKSLADLDAFDAQCKAKAGCAQAIYTLLAKSYLSMLAEDYVYESQKGHVKAYPEFKGVANIPKSQGYRAIFDNTGDEVDEEINLKGIGKHGDPFIFEGAPKRARHPSQAWLLDELERRDIGTGATRLETYKQLTELPRGKKEDELLLIDKGTKTLLGTPGKMSYLLLPGTNIGDLEMTKSVFDQMALVAKGQLDANELLRDVARMVEEDKKTMAENAVKLRKEFNMSEDAGYAEGVFEGQNVRIKKVWSGHTFTDEELEKLFAGETISFEANSSAGKPYTAKGKLEEQEFKGKTYFGFKADFSGGGANSADRAEGTFNGKQISFKKEWGGHKFSDEEVTKLLAGEQISFDATSKAGKSYTAKGKLEEQEFNGKTFFGFKADFS